MNVIKVNLLVILHQNRVSCSVLRLLLVLLRSASSEGVLMHKRLQFAVMFPIECASLPEHLFCFVLCLEFLERMCFHRRRAVQKTASPRTGLHGPSHSPSKFYE